MPLPRSIPAGQTQFTAQRYRALLEQRGHRVPVILKKLANQASEEAQTLLTQIEQLEQARLTTQADYLTIRTAARIRVLRGSGQTKTAYSEIEANRQRLKRVQQKAQHTEVQDQAMKEWAAGGRFAVYSAVMKELPSEQVILADQLLMDFMNKHPYLDAAQYQLMLTLALQAK